MYTFLLILLVFGLGQGRNINTLDEGQINSVIEQPDAILDDDNYDDEDNDDLEEGNPVDNFNGPNHELMIENNGISTEGTYEGDIVLTDFDVGFMNGNIQGDAIIESHYKWSSTTIPYEFESNLNSRARNAVHQAIAEYREKTCIRFRQRRSSDRDWIHFFQHSGCWSYVGKQGGEQKISLGRGCEYKSTAVHEILHALGFWHEQSRPDRDQYVRIHTENIISGMEHNFKKHKSNSYDHPYDYDSVMHYSNTAFTRNGRKTITAIRNPNRNFGQPWDGGLSEIDARQVNAHYKCSDGVTTTTTTTRPPTTSTTTRSTTTDNPNPGCEIPETCEDEDDLICNKVSSLGFCYNCKIRAMCPFACSGEDQNNRCQRRSERGWCTNPRRRRYMAKRCKDTCGYNVCLL